MARSEGSCPGLIRDPRRTGFRRRLPGGAHGIPAELIAQNQRERLIAATAEITSEYGYVGTTVRKIAKRAGVSTATFYTQFESLEQCLFATFWELHRRLSEELDVACRAEAEPRARPRAALRRSLQLFASDAPAARLLTVEILAGGDEGIRSQHEAIGRTAEQVGFSDEGGWGMVALACSLVAKRVMASEAEALPQLEGELGVVLKASKSLR